MIHSSTDRPDLASSLTGDLLMRLPDSSLPYVQRRGYVSQRRAVRSLRKRSRKLDLDGLRLRKMYVAAV
jgi:hypothetical protein